VPFGPALRRNWQNAWREGLAIAFCVGEPPRGKASPGRNSHEIKCGEANFANGTVKADNKSEDGFFGSKSWMK
jgi:hypothetical protein